jgi:hypothetical protein
MTRYDSTFSTEKHGYNCFPFTVGGRYIVHGFGGVVVWDLVTNTQYDCKNTFSGVFTAPRWQCAGVHDAETIAVVSGGNNIDYITGYLYNLRTHELTPSNIGVILGDCNSVIYSEGHWLVGAGTDLWLDGNHLGSNLHWRAQMVWPYIVVPMTGEIAGVGPVKAGESQVFQEGQRAWTFVASPTPTYGQLSKCGDKFFYTWNCASGTYMVEVGPSTVSGILDITTSLCHNECAPIVLHGPGGPTYLTGTEHELAYDGTEYEAKQGYLRIFNENTVITIPSGFVNQVAGVTLADSWLVVINDLVGKMSAFVVPFTEPKAEIPVVPSMLDPVGTVAVTPTFGTTPLTVTTTLTLTQGATTDVRFYGHRPDDTYARWGGANAYTASGVLDVEAIWGVFARMQGKNAVIKDTPVVAVTVRDTIVPPKPTGLMRGLVAGFDDPISDERLAWFVSQGVQSVRTGVGKTAAITAEIVAQLVKYPSIKPYYSIRFGSLDELNRVPEGMPFEAGNEPNLAGISPAKYAQWANSIRGVCAANSLTPYWCSVSNLNKTGLNWMAEVLRLCPWMEHLCLHRYNYGEVPNVGASPWGSRINEMRELISVIGTRAFRVTEIGCLCGPRCYKTGKWFWTKYHAITEQQQLDYVKAETALWKGSVVIIQGYSSPLMCEAVYYYQERSGVPSDYGFDAMYSTTDPGKHRKAWEVFRG